MDTNTSNNNNKNNTPLPPTTPKRRPVAFSSSLSSQSTLLGSPARRPPSSSRPLPAHRAGPIRLPSRLRPAAPSPPSPVVPRLRAATPPSPSAPSVPSAPCAPSAAAPFGVVSSAEMLENFAKLLQQREEEIASLKTRLAAAGAKAKEDDAEIVRMQHGIDYMMQIMVSLALTLPPFSLLA